MSNTEHPIDTIREALTATQGYAVKQRNALAALTEVEHQLNFADAYKYRARAEAAEAALAEATTNEDDAMRERDNYESMWRFQRDRAVAAETALAEAKQRLVRLETQEVVDALGIRDTELEAAEQRANDLQAKLTAVEAMDMTATANQWEMAFKNERERTNDLADALREIARHDGVKWYDAAAAARAALDRQEQR